MGTISRSKGRLFGSLGAKFGLSYILIMAAVLVLLNTYPLFVSQDLVFRSKETALQDSVSVMVYSLSGLDELTEENVSEAMAVVEETGLSRILVTDSAGKVLYDTRETNDALGEYSIYTEIVQALLGSDVFSASYRDGAFRSRAASPVLYRNQGIVLRAGQQLRHQPFRQGPGVPDLPILQRHRLRPQGVRPGRVVQVRHPEVQVIGLAGGGVGPAQAQDQQQRGAQRRRDDTLSHRSPPPSRQGQRTVNTAPPPGRLAASTVPPRLLTVSLTMARPRPVPPAARERALSTR